MECLKCICIWLGEMWDVSGGRGGVEFVRGLGLGFTNPVERGGVLDVCVFGLRWYGGLGYGL